MNQAIQKISNCPAGHAAKCNTNLVCFCLREHNQDATYDRISSSTALTRFLVLLFVAYVTARYVPAEQAEV